MAASPRASGCWHGRKFRAEARAAFGVPIIGSLSVKKLVERTESRRLVGRNGSEIRDETGQGKRDEIPLKGFSAILARGTHVSAYVTQTRVINALLIR